MKNARFCHSRLVLEFPRFNQNLYSFSVWGLDGPLSFGLWMIKIQKSEILLVVVMQCFCVEIEVVNGGLSIEFEVDLVL